jgi:uncharacterized membrane protein
MARDQQKASAAAPEWPAPAQAAAPVPGWPPPTGAVPPSPWGAGPVSPQPAAPPAPGFPLGPLPGAYAAPLSPPGAPARPLAGQAAPASSAPADWGSSSLGMEATHAAGLSYCGWWLTGLVIYFSERQSRFVRFHALQSVIYTGGLTMASVLAYVLVALLNDLYVATHQHVYGTLAAGVALVAFVAVLFAWWTPMIAAWFGVLLRIPFIAPYAERYAPPVAPDYSALDARRDA